MGMYVHIHINIRTYKHTTFDNVFTHVCMYILNQPNTCTTRFLSKTMDEKLPLPNSIDLVFTPERFRANFPPHSSLVFMICCSSISKIIKVDHSTVNLQTHQPIYYATNQAKTYSNTSATLLSTSSTPIFAFLGSLATSCQISP